MHFDFSQTAGITGVAGIPLIEQIVEYAKDNLRLPTYLAPLAALLLGAVINVAAAFYLHSSPLMGFYIGLMSGFSSSFWHEITTR